MREKNRVRIHPDMRELIEREQAWLKKQGIEITKIEATRIIANRYEGKAKYNRMEFEKKRKNRWNEGLGLK